MIYIFFSLKVSKFCHFWLGVFEYFDTACWLFVPIIEKGEELCIRVCFSFFHAKFQPNNVMLNFFG